MRVMTRSAAAMLLAASLTASAFAGSPTSTERFHYSWRLRGGLAWLASIRFPTSGYGELKTVKTADASPVVDTALKITPKEGAGFYLYQSQIDDRDGRTLMTYHGYEWGEKSRHERTLFDYVKRLARIRKETSEGVENRVKPIPQESVRDVLTAIYFLRQNATTIQQPLSSNIYSDGKLYPVVFAPEGRDRIAVASRSYSARVYKVVAAPDAQKRWPGAVKVWLTDDDAAIPVRIEIQRNFATLRLDLDNR